MASVDEDKYITLKQVENRQWFMLGVFSVLACVAIAVCIYRFNSRISVLEEKTNNLQNIIELYEKKNKEIKDEKDKYYNSVLGTKNVVVMNDVIGGSYE